METNNNKPNGPDKNLESAEYRQKLLRKLNCLISVLEVALSKVRVNLQAPGADLERLTRIRLNLENTLNVCRRAKLALERREPMPAGLPGDIAKMTAQHTKKVKKAAPKKPKIGADGHPEMTYRDYVEFSSVDEYYKFKKLGAIKKDEVAKVDWDDLSKKLGGTDTIA